MNYRVISLGNYPDQIFRHIQAAGCFIRCETTEVRGPVALVANGFVWAIGELSDVKPATKGKEAPQGYLWCLRNLQVVEGVICAHYTAPAMFQNGEAWEPQMLQASAQAELNRLIAPFDVNELCETSLQKSPPLCDLEATPSVDETVESEVAAFFADTSSQKKGSVSMPPDYQPDTKGLSKRERQLIEAGQMGLFS